MDSNRHLAQTFLARHSQAAAKVLEDFAPGEAASFMSQTTAANPDVLTYMLPDRAAALLASLPARHAASLMAALSPQPVAAILRHLDGSSRDEVIKHLPTPVRLRIDLILRQPRQTVGAWMDTRVLSVRISTQADNAKRRLRNHPIPVPCIFVVDADGRLCGAIDLPALLAAERGAKVADLAASAAAALSANATLAAAIEHPDWRHHDVLPVIDAGQVLVGILRHADLRAALANQERGMPAGDESDDFMSFTNAWCVGMSEVIGASLARTPIANDTVDTRDPGQEPTA
jgi:Mg/Co/Ni transporter MgtE